MTTSKEATIIESDRGLIFEESCTPDVKNEFIQDLVAPIPKTEYEVTTAEDERGKTNSLWSDIQLGQTQEYQAYKSILEKASFSNLSLHQENACVVNESDVVVKNEVEFQYPDQFFGHFSGSLSQECGAEEQLYFQAIKYESFVEDIKLEEHYDVTSFDVDDGGKASEFHVPSNIIYDRERIKLREVRVILVKLRPENLKPDLQRPLKSITNTMCSSERKVQMRPGGKIGSHIVSSETIMEKCIKQEVLEKNVRLRGDKDSCADKTKVSSKQNSCFKYIEMFRRESEPFSSKFCPVKFRKWYKRHYKTHSNKKSYKCPECPSAFKIFGTLRNHFWKHTGVLLSCEHCPKQFELRKTLVLHLRGHFGKKPHACSNCGLKFLNESSLKKHTETHTDARLYTCAVCSKSFKRKRNLKRHLQIHTDLRPYACAVCSKSFKIKNNLIRHLKIHADLRPYTCAVCSKSFKIKNNLIRHLKIHDDLRPYACAVCSKSFKRKCDLMGHLQIHTDLRPYACAVCSKSFKLKRTLKPHMQVHADDVRPYTCAVCAKTFKRKCHLIRHFSNLHSEENLDFSKLCPAGRSQTKYNLQYNLSSQSAEIFSCNHCHRKFKHKASLQYHIKGHFDQGLITFTNLNKGSSQGHIECPVDTKLFECSQCPAKFIEEQAFKRHLVSHSDDEPYYCTQCTARFRSKKGLMIHSKLHSNSEGKKYSCMKCPETFMDKDELANHLKVAHSSERPYCCQYCHCSFKTFGGLNKHARIHFSTLVSCAKYPQLSGLLKTQPKDGLKRSSELVGQPNLSQRKKTQNDAKLYKCDLCSKKFKTKFCLRIHLPVHSDKKPFSCDQCSVKFKTKNYLNIHMKTHSEKRRVTCNICSASLKKGSMNDHMKNHASKKPFVCSQCPAQFIKRRCLKEHLMSHTGERPYSCNECPAKFKNKRQLNDHLVRHTNDRPYSCNQCPAKYKLKLDLNHHLASHSDDGSYTFNQSCKTFETKQPLTSYSQYDSRLGRFSCAKCSAKFFSKHNLTRHLRVTHSNERPFSCPHCEKGFKRKSILTNHMVTHSKERPYSCPKCSVAYKRSDQLTAHLKTHTN